MGRRSVAHAFADPHGPAALADAVHRTHLASLDAQKQVQWERLRRQAHAIKAFAIANLPSLLREFEKQFVARGGVVLWASTGEEAADHVIEICGRHQARSIVKGKSMVSEEIELNARLRQAGISAIETDLGEFIVQLAEQRPSHIVGPALHLTRAQIGALFERKLGEPYTEDPAVLTEAARRRLRDCYLQAKVGLTGVNFAIAQTGTVVVVENEGNGGLAACVPDAHVMLMGFEKVIPRVEHLAVFLQLLARAATGQMLTTYSHHFLGPPEGKASYCIILDGNRSKLLSDPLTRQSLYCIRCGACLGVCPVYRRAGGWAYGSAYSGPIGAAITPQLSGLERAGELPFASTLCGACREACPVDIDLPHQLVYLRHKAVEAGLTRGIGSGAMRWWSASMRSLLAYRRLVAMARAAQILRVPARWFVRPLREWAAFRTLPRIARPTFKEWWKQHHGNE